MNEKLKLIINNIYDVVSLLEQPVNMTTKHMLVYRLEEQFSRLSRLFNQVLLSTQTRAKGVQAVTAQGFAINRSELSKYNGKSGNPAYVAVNGVVYDVTNNAAWAAASHFGLSAGRELTGAHASCHVNQDVLSKLKVVGRLDDGLGTHMCMTVGTHMCMTVIARIYVYTHTLFVIFVTVKPIVTCTSHRRVETTYNNYVHPSLEKRREVAELMTLSTMHNR